MLTKLPLVVGTALLGAGAAVVGFVAASPGAAAPVVPRAGQTQADCAPPATLQDGVCVTVVIDPAPKAAAPAVAPVLAPVVAEAPAAAVAPRHASGTGSERSSLSGRDHPEDPSPTATGGDGEDHIGTEPDHSSSDGSDPDD